MNSRSKKFIGFHGSTRPKGIDGIQGFHGTTRPKGIDGIHGYGGGSIGLYINMSHGELLICIDPETTLLARSMQAVYLPMNSQPVNELVRDGKLKFVEGPCSVHGFPGHESSKPIDAISPKGVSGTPGKMPESQDTIMIKQENSTADYLCDFCKQTE